jgi:hypothetical protein
MHGLPDFHTAYDGESERRVLDAGVRQARMRASQEISDLVARDIAMIFRSQEAHEAHLEQLARLHAIVREQPLQIDGAVPAGFSQRSYAAFVRAKLQGNYSALEGLQRELDRDRDEEETAVMLALMQ